MDRQAPGTAARYPQSPPRRDNTTSKPSSLSSSKEPKPRRCDTSSNNDDDIPDCMTQSGFLNISEITNEDGFNVITRSFERKNGSFPEKLCERVVKEGEVNRRERSGPVTEVKMLAEEAEVDKAEGEGKTKAGFGDDDWVLLEKNETYDNKRLE